MWGGVIMIVYGIVFARQAQARAQEKLTLTQNAIHIRVPWVQDGMLLPRKRCGDDQSAFVGSGGCHNACSTVGTLSLSLSVLPHSRWWRVTGAAG